MGRNGRVVYVCGFLVLTLEGMVGWWDFSLDIWEGMVG